MRRVQDYRIEERERQRRCRERRRPAGGGGRPVAKCHAPASDGKLADLLVKMLESWDQAVAVSRASLGRRIPTILRGSALFSGQAEAVTGELSRASLAADLRAAPWEKP
jgi:hypothetical protein